jgi:hypothetical protein
LCGPSRDLVAGRVGEAAVARLVRLRARDGLGRRLVSPFLSVFPRVSVEQVACRPGRRPLGMSRPPKANTPEKAKKHLFGAVLAPRAGNPP